MKGSKTPDAAVVTSPSQKKLKQARLPFKIISDVSPIPIDLEFSLRLKSMVSPSSDTAQPRKRKLSSQGNDTATKIGKIAKENDVVDELVVQSDEETIVPESAEAAAKLPNPYAKFVNTAFKKWLQKNKTPKKRKTSKCKTETSVTESSADTSAPSTSKQTKKASTNPGDDSMNDSTTSLTPKQLQKRLESAKKKEQREKEKVDREMKRQQEKEERDRVKREKKEQKKKEREEKEEAKKKEKEEKEEQKKKEREEKEKQKEMEKTGKHASSGDETPPIPEEELEQQKIEHERQMQKEKECQAREAEEVRQLDIELLHQRAIEAEEEKIRELTEPVAELRGMNTSWSHHRLCDLQRQAARWRHSRPSIPDTTKHYMQTVLKKSCSAQLTKPESTLSIGDGDGIFINLSRLGSCRDESENSEACYESTCLPQAGGRTWRASASDVNPYVPSDLVKAPSYPRSGMRRSEMQGRAEGGKDGSQISRSESTISRCTPHTPHTPRSPGPPDSASVDSNPMPTIYRCRAPIASLDCMDDFSANSQQMLDQAGEITVTRHMSTYLGNHTTMPSVVTPGLRYKNLGKSGLRVPNIGLGIWTMLNEENSEDIVMTALENGINLFDLSEAHCAKGEAELGRILKKRNVRRTSIIITTKIYWSTKSDERGLSRKHIIESVKASLSRLQLDYIDVVLLHKVDPVCPMEELVRAMNFVINQGWVMYWGTARWSPSEIMDAYTNCRQFNCITPIVEQTEYHMFCREKPELYMPELYHKIGVGMMAWSAITTGKGLGREEITGLFAKSRFNRKYSTFSWCEEELRRSSGSKEQVAGEDTRTYADKLRDLSNLANSLNCSLSQLAVAWCLKNESVNCLLLGATSVEHFKENIHALQIVPQLSAVVMAEIERLLANKPQRPPMVSTLAMRNQQQNATNGNTVRVDMTGASTPESGSTRAVVHEVDDDIIYLTPTRVTVHRGSGASTSVAGSPKPDTDNVVEAEASTPGKESGRGFCEIQ